MAIVTVGITLVVLVLTARLGLVKSLKEVLYRSAGAHQTMGCVCAKKAFRGAR